MVRRAVDGTPRFSSLPCDRIQTPPPGIFTSEVLQWYAEEAYIPVGRLDDFIQGEEARPESACRFSKKKLVARVEHGATSRAFHCHFGPTDLRGKVRKDAPSVRTTTDGKHPIARSTELGMSLQRGCQCGFVVIQYTDRPEAVLVRWLKRSHLDKDGNVCHGLVDPDAIYSNAHLPHTLSRPLREFVERLLLSKVEAINIVEAHNKMVKEEIRTDDFSDAPLLWSRDMQLGVQDVLNIQAAMKGRSAYTAKNDHINLALWVDANPQHVIFYEPGSLEPFRPFALVVATPWQLKKLATLGNEQAVSMDATFGTNEYEFQLFTLVAFDEFQNGIPCAWVILERHSANDLIQFLSAVKERVETLRFHTLNLSREWAPTCFVIDVAPEESQAIRTVFPGVRILLCFYHVRKSWRKQLYIKVKSAAHKAEMNRELGAMMYNHSQLDPVAASNDFIGRWDMLEHDFVVYYKAQWHRKLERWVATYRHFRHANQNTNGAIERYHKTLKDQLHADKKVKLGRKITWLVEKLVNDVEHWFWMRSGLKSQGRVRNTIAETYMMKTIAKTRDIPDADVHFTILGGRQIGQVISSSDRSRFHLVENFESDDSSCTCPQGLEGNTCKHKIKCLLLAGHGEVELMFHLGTKLGSMCGGLNYAANVAAGGGVLTPSQVTDVSYAQRFQQPQVQAIPNTIDTDVPTEVPLPQNTVPQPDPPVTKEDLLSFVDDAFQLFGENQQILKHAVRGMSSWFQNLRLIDARTNPANPRDIHDHMAPSAIPFRPVPGASRSLQPLTSFVDRIGRKHRRRARMPNPYSGVHAPKVFTKKAAQKETWQQGFDRERAEEDRLNQERENAAVNGEQGSQNSQQSTGRGRGRRGGRGSRGRGPGPVGHGRRPLEEVPLNVFVVPDSQEFNFFPGG